MTRTLNDILEEAAASIDFAKALTSKSKFKIKLDEAEDDDFAGDEPPADDGPDADDDFSGDDLGGDFGGGPGSPDSGDDDDEDTGDPTDVDDSDDHEPDPDFTDGVKGGTPVLDAVPSAETIYDSEGVFKSIKGVIESLSKEQLVEMPRVKKCLELIFSGKKLKPEDLEFDNIQNAIFLISKIVEPLNDRTKSYAKLKLKAPLQVARDKDKLELADRVKDIEKKRDTILNIDRVK